MPDLRIAVGVRFLDYEYEWDETGDVAKPVGYERFRCTSRVLFHADDIAAHGSFEQFRATVMGNPLRVEPDRVEYRLGPEGTLIECFRYDADRHGRFALPKVNGQTVNLRPEWTYQSPYLKGRFGDERITVTVGPLKQVYDFGEAAAR